VAYDRLLIATGSDPFIIPVPGKDLPGVIAFRDMKDVDTMLAAAQAGKAASPGDEASNSAVVIGGGLLGLEAAHGLSLRGMKVTVIHLMPTLMERQLDEAAGWLLKTALESRGQTILTGADTAEIYGEGKVEGVRLKDGREIPASLVVMAVGIRPSVALARAAGLEVNRGIKVDDHMVTSDPAILAVGECVEHDGQVYGLVAPLWDMCRSLADGLTDRHTGYRGSVTSTKLKVAGLDVFSAGDFSAGPAARTFVLRDAARDLQARRHQGRQDHRRRALWRYRRWWLVFRPAQEGRERRRLARPADLRTGLCAMSASGGGALDPKAAVAALSTMPRSAAATASPRSGRRLHRSGGMQPRRRARRVQGFGQLRLVHQHR
jgi:nitrite reductase (NADH) large subunit